MAKIIDDFDAVIGELSFFKGNIEFSGHIRIDGKYEGQELVVDHLVIGRTGKVRSNIIANTIVVEGVIIGNIEAKTRVMLMPTSAILGDIKTPELIIQNGVVLEGKCIISPELEKNQREIIEKRYQS